MTQWSVLVGSSTRPRSVWWIGPSNPIQVPHFAAQFVMQIWSLDPPALGWMKKVSQLMVPRFQEFWLPAIKQPGVYSIHSTHMYTLHKWWRFTTFVSWHYCFFPCPLKGRKAGEKLDGMQKMSKFGTPCFYLISQETSPKFHQHGISKIRKTSNIQQVFLAVQLYTS